ncbi:heme acquisition protein HasA [Pectobacterium cacticida]|uniref:heme acquisition protein HasA n=1 Tax=Pectobacterium cacticida TaxID=69221 RepID=UPI0039868FBB
MSFSITYSPAFIDANISNYLTTWSGQFGDVNHTLGNVNNNNTGGFYGGETFIDGTQYAITSTANNVSALIAEGDLTYTLFAEPAHTLYGSLDSLTFGNGLKGGTATGTEYSLTDTQVAFSGLDITSGTSEGQSGEVHQVVYGLMGGTVQSLLDSLESIFSNLNAPNNAFDASFSALDANSDGIITEAEIASYTAPAASVDVVGVADTTVDLLAA